MMARKAANGAIGEVKRVLIRMALKHQCDLWLVDSRWMTIDCGECSVRANGALPLSERTYTCPTCGSVKPRDRNSAGAYRVKLVSLAANHAA